MMDGLETAIEELRERLRAAAGVMHTVVELLAAGEVEQALALARESEQRLRKLAE